MGVCIETFLKAIGESLNKVTPYMGVCIETCSKMKLSRLILSHPIWVCVLKLMSN